MNFLASSAVGDSRRQARKDSGDATDTLGQLSMELGAGLTKSQIAAAMALLRQGGVNPSALVAITQELRREAQQQQQQQQQQQNHYQ